MGSRNRSISNQAKALRSTQRAEFGARTPAASRPVGPERAQQRLSARSARMSLRGKPNPKTIVAMARELVGYLRATLQTRAEDVVR